METTSKGDTIQGGTQKAFYNEEDRELCECMFCGKVDFFELDSEKGLTIVKCKNCDLIYTNPRAKAAQENYFGDETTFYNEARLIFAGKKIHHRDRNYEYEINKIKKIKSKGILLDVGSNLGFFLKKAREAGFEVEGLEPSPSLAKISSEKLNLKVTASFLENADLPENNYDVITLIDVFEHVCNPRELLEVSSKLLKRDGIIAIKVPNGDYNYFKMKLGKLTGKGKQMDIWNCCEHVVHYTPKTFSKMIESCGYRVKTSFIPLPINSPICTTLEGHYYKYTSPVILDWKRILLRNLFYYVGKIGYNLTGKTRFGPDLMFIIEKK